MVNGRHFDRSVILLCVRRHLANGLSLRNLEEILAERGISVDHATIHGWIVRYSPDVLGPFNRRKRPVIRKWHIDETYIKVRGQWRYLYRVIDSNGDTVEFWFSERCNHIAARRFLRKAFKRHGRPERIAIYRSRTGCLATSIDPTDGSLHNACRALVLVSLRGHGFSSNSVRSMPERSLSSLVRLKLSSWAQALNAKCNRRTSSDVSKRTRVGDRAIAPEPSTLPMLPARLPFLRLDPFGKEEEDI